MCSEDAKVMVNAVSSSNCEDNDLIKLRSIGNCTRNALTVVDVSFSLK